MVFKSLQLLSRSKGPDEFWRKRKIFKLAAVCIFDFFLAIFIEKKVVQFCYKQIRDILCVKIIIYISYGEFF